MTRFRIQTHGRLQEWVAEERGYFTDEGLDYEFVENQLMNEIRPRVVRPIVLQTVFPRLLRTNLITTGFAEESSNCAGSAVLPPHVAFGNLGE